MEQEPKNFREKVAAAPAAGRTPVGAHSGPRANVVAPIGYVAIRRPVNP